MHSRLKELIENVDDVTIKHHVIVPRASWDEIVLIVNASVAQAVERAAHNREVSGSSPDGGTITSYANACRNCGHEQSWHLGARVCQVFACGCENYGNS